MSDTSIGVDDPGGSKQSGIDDEASKRKRKERDGSGGALDDDAGHDVTREDIESGNDRNVSADQGNRSGRTSKTLDDTIELGN